MAIAGKARSLLAGVVAAAGWLMARAARWIGRPRLRFVGYLVVAFAFLLAIGSLLATVRIQRAEAGHPPMGALVDVGGYRLHVLAEGDAHGGPTVVWIGGGHAAGQRSRLRYLATSSRSDLVRAPSGTGHNFPYQVPEFVVETVRRVVASAGEARRPERGPQRARHHQPAGHAARAAERDGAGAALRAEVAGIVAVVRAHSPRPSSGGVCVWCPGRQIPCYAYPISI